MRSAEVHTPGLRARDTFAVLVVCNANICRSPHLVALLRRALAGRHGTTRIALFDGGVNADPGRPACSRLARRLTSTRQDLERHRSTPVTADALDRADLVIATSRDERSLLAQLSPESRSRTFTAYEAIRLSSRLTESDYALSPGETAAERTARLIGLMHLQRSALSSAPTRRSPDDGRFDIPDAHLSAARHSEVARHVRSTADGLAEVLAALTGTQDP
ncbi:protein-tyrosine-phosphatase [Aeromicrobium flavum]|uniref:Protein-tyrosine-phosphatase n=1 Tax=Aeromicrobium flavum TaxID=416568 RepID=A0A512HWI4_9ACTN|nr:hypothetical protein [Aeromicrobium flavum]GEO89808.1 protein-tyrosine-phosphatase [Aeromicrobium flavum]